MQTSRTESKGAGESDQVIYCVIPPRLARIKPRLCEHFAAEHADVEVVVDQRIGERRDPEGSGAGIADVDELAARLTPGLERRTPGGRRTAVPIAKPGGLPPELSRYEQDLTFLAVRDWNTVAAAAGTPVQDEDWQRRCISAEQQALHLARALIGATETMRSQGGLSPRRFLEVTRAERAINRYYRWRSARDGPRL